MMMNNNQVVYFGENEPDQFQLEQKRGKNEANPRFHEAPIAVLKLLSQTWRRARADNFIIVRFHDMLDQPRHAMRSRPNTANHCRFRAAIKSHVPVHICIVKLRNPLDPRATLEGNEGPFARPRRSSEAKHGVNSYYPTHEI